MRKRKSSRRHPGVGLALMMRPQCSPVEHKQSHKTSTSDKATLWPWWIKKKNKIRSLLIMFEHYWKHGHCLITKITKYPPILVNTSDCCFFTNHNFTLVTLPFFSKRFKIPSHTIIPTSWKQLIQSKAP